MSTTKIREALDWMRQQSIGNPKVRPMVEAENIEQGKLGVRDAALEEVAAKYEKSYPGWHSGRTIAREVRASKSQPARRYLDAEKVRETLLARGRDHRHIRDRVAVVREVMRDLDLDPDAAPACTCGAKDSSKPETLQAAHYADCPTAHTEGGR